MRTFLKQTDAQRRNIFELTSHDVHLPAQVVEKDFWVTVVLQAIFSLPIAEHLVFKGGTSLSKGWNLIDRFSEDIDLAVDPRFLGAREGDLTKKQIKTLRKASSLFVLEQLSPMIEGRLAELGLKSFLNVSPQPNGEGDGTYPEPRQVYITYKSVFADSIDYLRPNIVLEIGARSLLEPTESIALKCMLDKKIPIVPLVDAEVSTAIPAKTFLEKAFLLHEIFSVEGRGTKAERKSRHLYDLYMMKDKDFAQSAVNDAELWESIRHHREVFTSVQGLDYTPDVRRRLQLVPRADIIEVWRKDYEAMKESMIYGSSPTFEELIAGMTELQERFRSVSQLNL